GRRRWCGPSHALLGRDLTRPWRVLCKRSKASRRAMVVASRIGVTGRRGRFRVSLPPRSGGRVYSCLRRRRDAWSRPKRQPPLAIPAPVPVFPPFSPELSLRLADSLHFALAGFLPCSASLPAKVNDF